MTSNVISLLSFMSFLLYNLKHTKMKKAVFTISIITLVFSFVSSNTIEDSDFPSKNSYQSPPMFVLTEMNGLELDEKVYFTLNYDKNFELITCDRTV